MEINEQTLKKLSFDLSKKREIERDKLDFKRQWYKLKNKKSPDPDRDEFSKDICAIANKIGLTGFIIIGLDEKTGNFYDSPLIKSGINDVAQLRDILANKVDKIPNFELDKIEIFEGRTKSKKIISIIEIPPSLEKPHILYNYKNYKNYTPIRKGTQIVTANRSDFELMYYDRKNIEPDYKLDILCETPKPVYNPTSSFSGVNATINYLIQNTGRRPAAISKSILYIREEINSDYNIIKFIGHDWTDLSDKNQVNQDFSYKKIIIPYNHMRQVLVNFHSETTFEKSQRAELDKNVKNLKNLETYNIKISLELINGITCESDWL